MRVFVVYQYRINASDYIVRAICATNDRAEQFIAEELDSGHKVGIPLVRGEFEIEEEEVLE